MDKNRKHHREKTIPAEELADFSPPGASFSTEEGRTAQGMRPDIGAERELNIPPESEKAAALDKPNAARGD